MAKVFASQDQAKDIASAAALTGPRPAIPKRCQVKACAVMGPLRKTSPLSMMMRQVEYEGAETKCEYGSPGQTGPVQPDRGEENTEDEHPGR